MSSRRTASNRGLLYLLLAAAIVSLPNLLFFLHAPREFLLRGSYVVRGGPSDWAFHLFWTFLLPFHYPDIYRLAVGPSHFTDGVSTSLKLAGLNPVHPLVGAAFVVGLIVAWRRRREPAIGFLYCVWLLGSLLLGFAGPSLTRLLILLPVYLAFAAIGIGTLIRLAPWTRFAVAAALLLILGSATRDYFAVFPASAQAQYVYSQAATPIGQRAAELAAKGQRVVCVVSKDFNTVRYLTHAHPEAVRIVEFYRRPLDPRRIPIGSFLPQVLLLENAPPFAAYRSVFPPERITAHSSFAEIQLGG
jgi:hypothetical protein